MKSWEAETFRENRETVEPFGISLEEISEGQENSDGWSVPFG
jgi:hypothetical protein